MKIQELIERYKSYEGTWDSPGAEAARKCFIRDLEQLDEPQKVVVPQFIDEKIKYCKATDGYGLFHAMDYCYNFKECADWLESNEEIFALAWIFGYEVEKEKRYVVTLKNGQPLVKSQSGNTLYFNQNITAGNYKASRKEMEEAGFGWVFDCPGIEIEEVEE